MLTDEAIIAVLDKYQPLALSLRPPFRMVGHGDMLRFERPSELTFYGEALMEFARDLLTVERERCARICESVNNHDNPMTARDCADEIRSGR